MSKVLTKAIGVLALSVGMASTAFAAHWDSSAHYGYSLSPSQNPATNVVSAPEIDPAGALSGLTLLLGGLAVVRGSRAKK